ncbi:MAG: hypothetical protein V4625_02135 [Pseudomonadota bacterium]
MWPSPTDFFALLGINVALCAVAGWLLCRSPLPSLGVRWALAVLFLVLWLPVGSAHIPAVAYVRGVTSDLSVTLLVLACIGLARRLRGTTMAATTERLTVFFVVAVAALFLYPTALGWGSFDVYRLGWGSPVMLMVLLVLCVACWLKRLRLLPLLLACAVLAWAAGLMESGNLWDYLMDPWLAVTAFVQCFAALITGLMRRVKPSPVSPLGLKG